jgi:hypothetical protein
MYRVITGNAKDVESQLNELRRDWHLCIEGMSATNEQTTVLVKVYGKK